MLSAENGRHLAGRQIEAVLNFTRIKLTAISIRVNIISMSDPIHEERLCENYAAFQDCRLLACGSYASVLAAVLAAKHVPLSEAVVMLEPGCRSVVETDCPPGAEALPPHPAGPAEAVSRRGRPKLGVVSHEVTLLPRHWEWLEKNPAGASAKLREIVEVAMRASRGKERRMEAFENLERFMNAVAGNLPGAEEVTRAVYAGRLGDLEHLMSGWPADVRRYLLELAGMTRV
jgi:hypothetical protein